MRVNVNCLRRGEQQTALPQRVDAGTQPSVLHTCHVRQVVATLKKVCLHAISAGPAAHPRIKAAASDSDFDSDSDSASGSDSDSDSDSIRIQIQNQIRIRLQIQSGARR